MAGDRGADDRVRADEALLTYRQLAERLGITPDSARSKARRRRWSITLDNQGIARVRVPLDALPDAPPPRPERILVELGTHPVQEELRRAREQIAELEAQLIEARAVGIAADAKVAAERAIADELRRALEWHRRPWWRRLLG